MANLFLNCPRQIPQKIFATRKKKFLSIRLMPSRRCGKCTPIGARAPATEASTLWTGSSTMPSCTLFTTTPRFAKQAKGPNSLSTILLYTNILKLSLLHLFSTEPQKMLPTNLMDWQFWGFSLRWVLLFWWIFSWWLFHIPADMKSSD